MADTSSNALVEIVEDKNKDENTPSWSDLLPELLSSIISRVFMGDFVAFRATCKSWESISSLSKPLLPTAPDSPLTQLPYLMSPNTRTKSFNFYHPIINVSYQMDIPEIYHCDIRFSKDNWLIISGTEFNLFMFNPFTKKRIQLPDIPFHYGFSRMCFSSTPTSPDFVVYGFADSYSAMEVCTWKMGEEDWTIDYYDSCSRFTLAGCAPVLCNGLMYCLGVTGNLGIYDPTSSDPYWIVDVKPCQRIGNSQRQYLVESEGDLFSVFVSRDWRKVDVLKLDFETISWKPVESLDDKMLFVSLKSSFSAKAVVKGARNKVYFPRFRGDEGLFYSLKTKKFHCISGSCSSISGSNFQAKEMKQSIWIKMCS